MPLLARMSTRQNKMLVQEPPPIRVLDGFVGFCAPLLGVITSFQEQLEFGLRLTSLVIGIAIGAVHLWRLLKTK